MKVSGERRGGGSPRSLHVANRSRKRSRTAGTRSRDHEVATARASASRPCRRRLARRARRHLQAILHRGCAAILRADALQIDVALGVGRRDGTQEVGIARLTDAHLPSPRAERRRPKRPRSRSASPSSGVRREDRPHVSAPARLRALVVRADIASPSSRDVGAPRGERRGGPREPHRSRNRPAGSGCRPACAPPRQAEAVEQDLDPVALVFLDGAVGPGHRGQDLHEREAVRASSALAQSRRPRRSRSRLAVSVLALGPRYVESSRTPAAWI